MFLIFQDPTKTPPRAVGQIDFRSRAGTITGCPLLGYLARNSRTSPGQTACAAGVKPEFPNTSVNLHVLIRLLYAVTNRNVHIRRG
jgi:hypothetical protein